MSNQFIKAENHAVVTIGYGDGYSYGDAGNGYGW